MRMFVVPANAGTHTQRLIDRAIWQSLLNNQCWWSWGPAFAGTTKQKGYFA
jgi:hypothetical protein